MKKYIKQTEKQLFIKDIPEGSIIGFVSLNDIKGFVVRVGYGEDNYAAQCAYNYAIGDGWSDKGNRTMPFKRLLEKLNDHWNIKEVYTFDNAQELFKWLAE